MALVWYWIKTNPASFAAFAKLGGIATVKLVLFFTGGSAQLEHWNAGVNITVDWALLIFAGIQAGIGSVHASRGPSLPPNEQATVIAAKIEETNALR